MSERRKRPEERARRPLDFTGLKSVFRRVSCAGRRGHEERAPDRGVPARVRQQHGQGGVDVEPDAGEPDVRVRVAAERVHLVAAQEQSDRGRHQRDQVRQGPVQQPAGDAGGPAVLRRVHVLHEEHTRREQRVHHAEGGAPAVQSVSGQVRRRHR